MVYDFTLMEDMIFCGLALDSQIAVDVRSSAGTCQERWELALWTH